MIKIAVLTIMMAMVVSADNFGRDFAAQELLQYARAEESSGENYNRPNIRRYLRSRQPELNRNRRQPVDRSEEPLEPLQQYYKPASGPAVAPKAVPEQRNDDLSNEADFRRPQYVEYNGEGGEYEPPVEQRELESSIRDRADAYHASEKAGVYQTEDRMEFQIHGHEGPHSYRYGYDTGHGYNRQFRYEEKDGYGLVKGRYGFFDKYGKLHVVNYSSHPEHGFKAHGDGIN